MAKNSSGGSISFHAYHRNIAPSTIAPPRKNQPLMPTIAGSIVTTNSSTVYSRICQRVYFTPRVTGSIGTSARVVGAAEDRQRPEVRRCPYEHDQHQQPGVRPVPRPLQVGHRGPASSEESRVGNDWRRKCR